MVLGLIQEPEGLFCHFRMKHGSLLEAWKCQSTGYAVPSHTEPTRALSNGRSACIQVILQPEGKAAVNAIGNSAVWGKKQSLLAQRHPPKNSWRICLSVPFLYSKQSPLWASIRQCEPSPRSIYNYFINPKWFQLPLFSHPPKQPHFWFLTRRFSFNHCRTSYKYTSCNMCCILLCSAVSLTIMSMKFVHIVGCFIICFSLLSSISLYGHTTITVSFLPLIYILIVLVIDYHE